VWYLGQLTAFSEAPSQGWTKINTRIDRGSDIACFHFSQVSTSSHIHLPCRRVANDCSLRSHVILPSCISMQSDDKGRRGVGPRGYIRQERMDENEVT